MSTGNIKKIIMFLGPEVRLVRGADNLTAIYEPIVQKNIYASIRLRDDQISYTHGKKLDKTICSIVYFSV
jgi:hypothetical protein